MDKELADLLLFRFCSHKFREMRSEEFGTEASQFAECVDFFNNGPRAIFLTPAQSLSVAEHPSPAVLRSVFDTPG